MSSLKSLYSSNTKSSVFAKGWTLLFYSICKFGSFKNSFETITSLSGLYFRFRRFILLVQKKSDIYDLWQQHKQLKTNGDKWELTWYFQWGIYKSIPTWTHSKNFTSSSKSTEFKDILPWNISQIITMTVPISTRISKRNAMKQGIPLWTRWKVSGNWDNSMIRISQWRVIVEQILVSKEINKCQRSSPPTSSTRIGKSVLMMDIKVSKDKHISRWVDAEKVICVRPNRIKYRAQRQRRWLTEKKHVRHWVR